MSGLENRLRQQLQAAASTVEPDPAAWRQLQGRIRRRRTAVRGAGLALAGAAVALVAVVVLPLGGDQRIEFAPTGPGAVATQPSASDPAAVPDETPTTGGEGAGVPGTLEPEAGAILYSDGDSIHVADLQGEIVWTPAEGQGASTITDLAVRPAGTTVDFTMAYRFDVTADSPEDCGDISWTRVVGPDATLYPDPIPGMALPSDGNIAGGGLPGVDVNTNGDCLGAPVFASDGSTLAWLAEGTDGAIAFQAYNWGDQGPFECCLHSTTLDLGNLADAVLVGWAQVPNEAEVGGTGELFIRATDPEDGPGLFHLSVILGADESVRVPDPAALEAVVLPDGDPPGTLLDQAGEWSLHRLLSGGPDDVIGLAYSPPAVEGEAVPTAVTTELPFLLGPDTHPYLEAIGGTAVVGDGAAVQVLRWQPGQMAAMTFFDGAVSAALLAAPVSAADPVTVETPAIVPTPPEAPPTADPTPRGDTPPGTASGTGEEAYAPSLPPPSPLDAPPSEAVEQSAPSAVLDTAAQIRAAAQAQDYDALATLIPGDGFTSNYGGEPDDIAFYRAEEANGIDVLGTLAALLAEPPTEDDGGIFVWPRDYLEDGYLGYRVGITEAGAWIFYVTGD